MSIIIIPKVGIFVEDTKIKTWRLVFGRQAGGRGGKRRWHAVLMGVKKKNSLGLPMAAKPISME